MNSAKQALERVRDAMKKYPAVEFRWKSERGLSLDAVEKLLLELKEKSKSGSGGGGGGLGGR